MTQASLPRTYVKYIGLWSLLENQPHQILGHRLWPSHLTKLVASQWKGINRKQSTRWQHLSWLKASAFFSLQIYFSCYETQQLILGTGTAIWWVTEPHCLNRVGKSAIAQKAWRQRQGKVFLSKLWQQFLPNRTRSIKLFTDVINSIPY
jgi:hypothetical protein